VLAIGAMAAVGVSSARSPAAVASRPGDELAGPIPTSALVDSRQLLIDLRTLSADGMEGREIGTPGGAKARAYVLARFKASGLLPVEGGYTQTFVSTLPGGRSASRLEGVNVLGRITGVRTPGRYLVVSAHYDHIGVRGGRVFNGADDNASGTAALFALAAYFTAHPPAHSLVFAAFDGEEEGLLGSRAFVRRPPVPVAALAANVNADMVGRDPTNTLWVSGVFQQPFLRPYIEAVAAHAPVHLIMGHDDPRGPGVDDWTRDSDQYAFMQAGIPGIYVGVSDDDQHHQPTDDFETITREFYVRAVETLIQIVRQFDEKLDEIHEQALRPASAAGRP
jgi:hypothetical protein